MKKIKFIKTRAMAIVFVTMILPHAVSAKTIIMDCDGTYFKYSKSFWKNAEVRVRKDSDWEPWCSKNIKITDEGARCNYVVEKENGKTVYEYSYVDKDYIDYARKELSKRHFFCNNNKNHKLCDARAHISISVFLDNHNNDDKLYEVKEKPAWAHGCDSIGLPTGGPNHEKKDFYDLPLSVYQKMHLPKMGEKSCLKSSNFVVSEVKKINVTDMLDFLLLVQKLGPSSVSTRDHSVSCNLVE